MDARTTPPALRLPATALLVLVATAYLLGGNAVLEEHRTGKWNQLARNHPYFIWASTWSMFARRDRNQNAWIVTAQLDDGRWERVDIDPLFPTRWESGARYDRPAYRRDPRLRATFASAICQRMTAHPDLPQPKAVRIRHIMWRKTLGQREQPQDKVVSNELLIEFPCYGRVQRPPGFVL